jgi:hypothetical protein
LPRFRVILQDTNAPFSIHEINVTAPSKKAAIEHAYARQGDFVSQTVKNAIELKGGKEPLQTNAQNERTADKEADEEYGQKKKRLFERGKKDFSRKMQKSIKNRRLMA